MLDLSIDLLDKLIFVESLHVNFPLLLGCPFVALLAINYTRTFYLVKNAQQYI
jgi:hypothetical protein